MRSQVAMKSGSAVALRKASRSFCIAAQIRVLIVPTGAFSSSPIFVTSFSTTTEAALVSSCWA